MNWKQYKGLELKGLWAKPGCVDVHISRNDLHTYVILAERHDNSAASVTNAYEIYAEQVCNLFSVNPKKTVFFELYVQKNTFPIFYLFFSILFVVACSNQTPDYSKLCDIYAGIVNQPIDLSSKEGQIAEKVSKEFPKFFNSDFIYIKQAEISERYQFIKKTIESETNKDWDCEVIRVYYATQFGKSSD